MGTGLSLTVDTSTKGAWPIAPPAARIIPTDFCIDNSGRGVGTIDSAAVTLGDIVDNLAVNYHRGYCVRVVFTFRVNSYYILEVHTAAALSSGVFGNYAIFDQWRGVAVVVQAAAEIGVTVLYGEALDDIVGVLRLYDGIRIRVIGV